MSILQISDFELGEFSIAKDSYSDIEAYIEKYEKKYLIKILGVELYKLFKDDLDGDPEEPQDNIYKAIFDPIEEDSECEQMVNEGMKEMLKQFVFFHFTRENIKQKSRSGVLETEYENGSKVDYSLNLTLAYNKAVKASHVIQWFICEHRDDYPTYNGQEQQYITGL